MASAGAAWKSGLSLGVAVVGTAWTFAMMASETSGDGARWYDGRRWSWIVLPDRTVVVARDRRLRADGDPSRLLVEPRRPF